MKIWQQLRRWHENNQSLENIQIIAYLVNKKPVSATNSPLQTHTPRRHRKGERLKMREKYFPKKLSDLSQKDRVPTQNVGV